MNSYVQKKETQTSLLDQETLGYWTSETGHHIAAHLLKMIIEQGSVIGSKNICISSLGLKLGVVHCKHTL